MNNKPEEKPIDFQAINFLKNYQSFGYKIRPITAQNHLAILIQTNDVDTQKVLMIRIIEEVISSTEDLAMWLVAIFERKKYPDYYQNEWEYLLDYDAAQSKTNEVLETLSNLKKGMDLIEKFQLPPKQKIIEYMKIDEQTLDKVLDKILEAIQVSLNNRTAGEGALVRFHNKVKHGMIVLSDGKEVYIRDFRIKRKEKLRTNRNLFLPVDLERANKAVGTINSNSHAIKFLAALLITDYTYQIELAHPK